MPPSSGGRTDAGGPEDRRPWFLLRALRLLLSPSSWRRPSGRYRLGCHLRRQSPHRRRAEAILAVCALLAGFSVTIIVLSGLHPTSGRAKLTPRSPLVEAAPGTASSPAALDAEWAQYADHSTCADWAGADGVSAVPIGHSQLAWFFSDTFLGPVGAGTFKTISGFIHNSVVVQTTQRGTTRFTTLTGGGTCTAPGESSWYASSVVSAPTIGSHGERYWNADGIVVGGAVLRFYNGFTRGQPPFVPVSTTIAQFNISGLRTAAASRATGGRVARPELTSLPMYTPVPGGTPIAWGSALLRDRHTVYIYGWASPDHTEALKQLYLARAPVGQLTDPAAWQYYAGAGQWAEGQQNARPVQPSGADFNISTGFSVLHIGGKYWLIQQDSTTGSPDIMAFPATEPWGSFQPGAGIRLYRSPDVGLDAAHDFRIMYEARAEPALSTGQNLVISYNVNSVGVTTGCQPLSAYTDTITRPRFISVPMTAFTSPPARFAVQSGPSPYTDVSGKAPGQWFNSWAYPGGCPPVPGLANVSAQAVGYCTVALRWPDAGLGLAYHIYRRALNGAGHSASYALVDTVSAERAQVTGLRRGVEYEFLVVPVNVRAKTGHGALATLTAY